MTLKTALEALESDAKAWDETASALTTASTNAGTETLTDSEFSFVGSETGLTATYASLQQRIVDLCSGGATETTAIASTLREVKRTYEGTDEAAKARLEGVWDVS